MVPHRHNPWLPLCCHPAKPCGVELTLHVRAALIPTGGLSLRYRLQADLGRILIPEPQTPVFCHRLWAHSCFEAFVGLQGESAYREFNLSPSGQWAAYAFEAYRQPAAWSLSLAPPMSLKTGENELLLEAELTSGHLPQNPEQKPLQLGLSAVIETQSGDTSYWALSHPAAMPDFHHADGFIHEIRP